MMLCRERSFYSILLGHSSDVATTLCVEHGIDGWVVVRLEVVGLTERNVQLARRCRNLKATAVLEGPILDPRYSTRHSASTAPARVVAGALRVVASAWRTGQIHFARTVASGKTVIHGGCCSRTFAGKFSIHNCSTTSWSHQWRRCSSWKGKGSLFLALAFAASCQNCTGKSIRNKLSDAVIHAMHYGH